MIVVSVAADAVADADAAAADGVPEEEEEKEEVGKCPDTSAATFVVVPGCSAVLTPCRGQGHTRVVFRTLV